jgi:hypothetical protein
MADIQFPAWLSEGANNTFVIDPNIAYPAILQALGVNEVDQYWVEVAYQIAKMEAFRIITDGEPPGGDTVQLTINSADDRKQRWALANLPKGRGTEAATQGREAVVHYDRVRGRF